MEELPNTDPISLSNVRAVFGGRPGVTETYLRDYTREGALAADVDWAVGDTTGSLVSLKGKGKMKVTGLTTQSVTTTSAVVSWNGARYSFARVAWPGGNSNVPFTTSNFTVPGLTSSAVSSITVTPMTRDSVLGSTMLTTSANTLPTQVATTTIGSITTDSALVSWTGGLYNKIMVSWTGATTGSSGDLNAPVTSYTATGLNSSASYTFTVTPLNSSNVTGAVRTANAATLVVPITSATATATSSSTVTLSWVGGTYSYVTITRSGATAFTVNSPTTSTSVSSLPANTSYTFTVTPYNSAGIAGTPQNATATTLSNTLENVRVTGSTTNTATIAWNANTFTKVVITWTGGSTGTSGDLVGVTSYTTPTTLLANKSYTFNVTPYSGATPGTVTQVNEWTQAIAATSATATVVSPNEISVSWTGGTYQFVMVYQNGTNNKGAVNWPSTSFVDQTCNDGTSYYYTVQFFNYIGVFAGQINTPSVTTWSLTSAVNHGTSLTGSTSIADGNTSTLFTSPASPLWYNTGGTANGDTLSILRHNVVNFGIYWAACINLTLGISVALKGLSIHSAGPGRPRALLVGYRTTGTGDYTYHYEIDHAEPITGYTNNANWLTIRFPATPVANHFALFVGAIEGTAGILRIAEVRVLTV